jgi:hypothetical protein
MTVNYQILFASIILLVCSISSAISFLHSSSQDCVFTPLVSGLIILYLGKGISQPECTKWTTKCRSWGDIGSCVAIDSSFCEAITSQAGKCDIYQSVSQNVENDLFVRVTVLPFFVALTITCIVFSFLSFLWLIRLCLFKHTTPNNDMNHTALAQE